MEARMQQRRSSSTHINAAEQAFYHGDRKGAYQIVRAALLKDPKSVDAWLWLSKLVDDTPRQRECLERALSLDPQNKTASDALERLRLQQLLATVQAPVLREQPASPRLIGVYLLECQLITPDQLQAALCEQGNLKRHGNFVQLGDVLLQKGWVSPSTLARALVAQINEKIKGAGLAIPRFLGEYLLAEGIITPVQLEAVLEEQMRLRMAGQRVALGSLLLRNKCIDTVKLHQILDQQRVEFYSSMGD
jgi:hypothetical protein